MGFVNHYIARRAGAGAWGQSPQKLRLQAWPARPKKKILVVYRTFHIIKKRWPTDESTLYNPAALTGGLAAQVCLVCPVKLAGCCVTVSI